MSLNDPLANVLSHMYNYEKLGKKEMVTDNNSKVIKEVLRLMQEEGFIGSYEEIEQGKGGKALKIHLIGSLNKCGTIKPRFRVKLSDYEKYEKRYLPAMDFGVLIVSTSKGIKTNTQAKKENLGGTLISYAY